MENPNPIVNEKSASKRIDDYNDSEEDQFDEHEIFDMIRNIIDPEHPLTLEQLNVVRVEHVIVVDKSECDENIAEVRVDFTPTIPHCSMATLIGLAIRVKLLRSLSRRWKVTVAIRKGTHQSELGINKQLNDKERVAAALENKHLIEVVNKCISP